MSKGFVTAAKEGTLLNLHDSPGAKRTSVEGLYGDDAIKLKVAAPPGDGRANAEVERFFSKLLDIPRSDVTIMRGTSSRDKIILARGVTQAVIHQALSAYLP